MKKSELKKIIFECVDELNEEVNSELSSAYADVDDAQRASALAHNAMKKAGADKGDIKSVKTASDLLFRIGSDFRVKNKMGRRKK